MLHRGKNILDSRNALNRIKSNADTIQAPALADTTFTAWAKAGYSRKMLSDHEFIEQVNVRNIRCRHMKGILEYKRGISEANAAFMKTAHFTRLEQLRKEINGGGQAIASMKKFLATSNGTISMTGTTREKLQRVQVLLPAKMQEIEDKISIREQLRHQTPEYAHLVELELDAAHYYEDIGLTAAMRRALISQRSGGQGRNNRGRVFEEYVSDVIREFLIPAIAQRHSICVQDIFPVRNIKLGMASFKGVTAEIDCLICTAAPRPDRLDAWKPKGTFCRVLAAVEVKRNPDDIGEAFVGYQQTLMWLSGRTDCYDAAHWVTKAYPTGHFVCRPFIHSLTDENKKSSLCGAGLPSYVGPPSKSTSGSVKTTETIDCSHPEPCLSAVSSHDNGTDFRSDSAHPDKGTVSSNNSNYSGYSDSAQPDKGTVSSNDSNYSDYSIIGKDISNHPIRHSGSDTIEQTGPLIFTPESFSSLRTTLIHPHRHAPISAPATCAPVLVVADRECSSAGIEVQDDLLLELQRAYKLLSPTFEIQHERRPDQHDHACSVSPVDAGADVQVVDQHDRRPDQHDHACSVSPLDEQVDKDKIPAMEFFLQDLFFVTKDGRIDNISSKAANWALGKLSTEREFDAELSNKEALSALRIRMNERYPYRLSTSKLVQLYEACDVLNQVYLVGNFETNSTDSPH